MNTVSLILAVLLSLLAATLGFGWFGSHPTVNEILGALALGAAFGWLGHLLPARLP